MLTLALSLSSSPAVAGEATILVEKRGLMPAFAWVDGQPIGRIKKKGPLEVAVEPGRHEVWYAAEPDGIVTLCHGVVDVQAGGAASTLYRDRGCEGLMPGWPDGPSAFKGAEVTFRVDGELDAWVSIDGGQRFAFPDLPFSLNLTPGKHTFVLYTDVMGGDVFDQGVVTLGPGETLPVTCTLAGCVGFDQPPVFITELREAPQIQIATPGVRFDFAVSAGATGASMTTTSSTTRTVTRSGAAIDMQTGENGFGMTIDVDDGMGGGGTINVDVQVDGDELGGAGMQVEIRED